MGSNPHRCFSILAAADWRLFAALSLLFVSHLAPTASGGENDWPHWRGAYRDGVVREASGWRAANEPEVASWLSEQPAWRTNVGWGATSPLVVDGRLYTMGWRDGRDSLICLDAATGESNWQQEYAAPDYGRRSTGDKGVYRGISATPEFDTSTGLMYSLGLDGELRCWDTRREGRLVWRLNLYDEFDADQRPDVGGLRGGASRRDYGYTTAPLVHGDSLIVEVGSTRDGTLAGFDKRTGRRLWMSAHRDEAGHSGGLVPMTIDGVPCVAVLTMRSLLVARLDTGHEGETVAAHPWTTDFANNIPTPAVAGQSIIVTSAYNQMAMCRLDVTLKGTREVWKNEVASGVCSPVIHDGHIYWAWRGVHCVDLASGKERWSGGNVGTTGSCLVTSDDRLIVLADQGDVTLVETARRSPDRYLEVASRRRLFRDDAWPHIVLAHGRLYCKDRTGDLVCFELGR